MSRDEQDQRVGAAYRRLRECERLAACLESKVKHMGRQYGTIARAAREGIAVDEMGNLRTPRVSDGRGGYTGWEELLFPSEDEFIDAVRRHREAMVDREEARRDWEAVSSP